MSINKTDAKTLKSEAKELKVSKEREQEILKTFPGYRQSEIEVFARLCEEYPDLMAKLDTQEAQRVVERVHALQYAEERRQAQTEELLDRSSFNPSRATWWAGKVVDLSLVVVGTALGAVAISRLGQSSDSLEAAGLDGVSSPFSDPTGAASPRPPRKRDNVIPFDRQAS